MSAIDPTTPTTGSATTESVRANFAAAKAEIEELQSDKVKTFIAAETLSGNRAVYLTPVGVRLADPASGVTAEVLGITTQAALSGESVNVQIKGELSEGSWSFIQGSRLWLGVSGTITQVIPTGATQVELGTALEPTKIFINIQPPLYLI